MTDIIGDLWAGIVALRWVFLFVAFLTATAFALEYRRKWRDAAGLLKVLTDELRLADRYGKTLEARQMHDARELKRKLQELQRADGRDSVFDEGYVYDRIIPAWVPADVPGAPQEPRRVPR